MIPDEYVLLVWTSLLFLPWAAVYLLFAPYRRAMLWSSAFALPFGLSELLFAGEYWSPPTLFDLSNRLHLDIESFVFLFAAGGVAAVAFNVVTGQPIEPAERIRDRHPRKMDGAGLALPGFVFPVALFLFGIPIGAGIVAMTAGAIARVFCRPDLLAKTIVGSLFFSAFYVALLASLVWAQPGYIDRFWSHDGAWLLRIGGIPLAEVLFGASFGAYWSGLYEQWRWTLGRPFACTR